MAYPAAGGQQSDENCPGQEFIIRQSADPSSWRATRVTMLKHTNAMNPIVLAPCRLGGARNPSQWICWMVLRTRSRCFIRSRCYQTGQRVIVPSIRAQV